MASAFVFPRQKNLLARNRSRERVRPEKKVMGKVTLSIIRDSFHFLTCIRKQYMENNWVEGQSILVTKENPKRTWWNLLYIKRLRWLAPPAPLQAFRPPGSCENKKCPQAGSQRDDNNSCPGEPGLAGARLQTLQHLPATPQNLMFWKETFLNK